jgi:chaperonin GroES
MVKKITFNETGEKTTPGYTNLVSFMRPIQDKVVIRPDPPETIIKGIHMPDGAEKKANRGTVLAVGPGRYFRDAGFVPCTSVKPGDVVYFGNHPSWELNKEKLVVIQEAEVLGVEE